MSEPPGRRDLKSLVSALVAAETAPEPTIAGEVPPASSSGPAAALEREAVELIQVYFELEQPVERDVVLEKLAAIDAPIVTEFLTVMMEEDEDEYVRAAAAAELALRGVPAAVTALERDLAEPGEPYFFENALAALAAVRGAAFYDVLRRIWLDPARDPEERRRALVGMESVDAARALAELVELVRHQTDVAVLPDDQIELAIMAFARHGHHAGREALRDLRGRLEAAPGLDAGERAELVGFVQEGIDLISAALDGERG